MTRILLLTIYYGACPFWAEHASPFPRSISALTASVSLDYSLAVLMLALWRAAENLGLSGVHFHLRKPTHRGLVSHNWNSALVAGSDARVLPLEQPNS